VGVAHDYGILPLKKSNRGIIADNRLSTKVELPLAIKTTGGFSADAPKNN